MDEQPIDITGLVSESGRAPRRCQPDERGWVPHGRCVAYKHDGHLHLEITYDHGVANGPYRDYWSNGRVSLEGQFCNGVREGEWRFYNPDGILREVMKFEGGQEVIELGLFPRGDALPEL